MCRRDRGNTGRALGDEPAAAARYDEALALDPGHLPSWINLGNVRMALRDYDGAEAAFEAALKAVPVGVDAAGADPAGGGADAQPSPALRAVLAEARYNPANLQRMTGRLVEALGRYPALLALCRIHIVRRRRSYSCGYCVSAHWLLTKCSSKVLY